ncbi:uncharacterized protein CEXT_129661 [Caerostris extrusa]|uniref:Uncharacterized protein n=1 Tax=Caerostris extrusa TaxID=172846 RepID=A0AAV4N2K4_CAEEX|nr:uncharacterized protein CEXT_129661 [Caerostris extrusa]
MPTKTAESRDGNYTKTDEITNSLWVNNRVIIKKDCVKYKTLMQFQTGFNFDIYNEYEYEPCSVYMCVTSSDREEEHIAPKERKGKIVTGALASNTVLPSVTIQTFAIAADLSHPNWPALKHGVAIGYVLGCIFGGVGFDYFDLPSEKIIMICIMLLVLGITSASIPISTSPLKLWINFFVNGVCTQFCNTVPKLKVFGCNPTSDTELKTSVAGNVDVKLAM